MPEQPDVPREQELVLVPQVRRRQELARQLVLERVRPQAQERGRSQAQERGRSPPASTRLQKERVRLQVQERAR